MKISELPEEIRLKALDYQRNSRNYDKETDNLAKAFSWCNTKEKGIYWDGWDEKEPKPTIQKHYDNTNGSLYKFCEDKQLNAWEFDIIKRVMRCRKKGNFIEDLEKTKFLIDLYLKEFETTTKLAP